MWLASWGKERLLPSVSHRILKIGRRASEALNMKKGLKSIWGGHVSWPPS